MPSTPETFDTHMAQWLAEQEQPWGRLRYRVSRANLARHLPSGPLRILDIGGGNGRDALTYAAEGHSVTLIDFSPAMLAAARQEAAEQGIAERLETIEGDVGDLGELAVGAGFDVALCHNVIQYVDEPATLLRQISAVLRPGGLLSLIAVNRFSEVYREAFQRHDLAAAQAKIGSGELVTQTFNAPIALYSASELGDMLSAAGASVVGTYGIRCLCDWLPNGELKTDPARFAQLEELELALSSQFPYYLTARFAHVVGRIPTSGR